MRVRKRKDYRLRTREGLVLTSRVQEHRFYLARFNHVESLLSELAAEFSMMETLSGAEAAVMVRALLGRYQP
jgi:hypothetical protein